MSSLTHKEAQNWAVFSHLAGLIGSLATSITFGGAAGALVIWLLKRDASEVVDRNGREALNFQISMLLWIAIAAWSVVGVVAIPLLHVLAIVFPIIAAVAASKGENYRYPLTIRFF
jgi:uncharacterized Tic20 family protein